MQETIDKHTIETLDRNKRYKLPCGHNKLIVGLNVYPFKTFMCLTCGLKSDNIQEVEE